MAIIKGTPRKCFSPRALRVLCQIIICVLILASQIYADNGSPVGQAFCSASVGNTAHSQSIPAASLPSRFVDNNRFVAGIRFGGFNFKKIYPYFSVDIENAHNPSFHPFENHHLYSGIVLLSLGKITHQQYLRTLGSILIIDDLIEHSFNVTSALHFTANHIDQPLYAKLTGEADSLFGKKKP